MDEKRFELTLGEVDHYHDESQCLEVTWFWRGQDAVEDWVDKQRAKVFHEKDRLPCDLGPYDRLLVSKVAFQEGITKGSPSSGTPMGHGDKPRSLTYTELCCLRPVS